ncbi:MAG: hypothetical protein R8F63_04790 [Acidimicrobiales bacterium]|nr:hypothetical protein [Acidimicrobiales bacterium]
MRSILASIRGFIRAFRAGEGLEHTRRDRSKDDALARTLRDSSHAAPWGGFGASYHTSAQTIAESGADAYAKSFEKRERSR